ncbi:MAG: hypothetical protein VX663_05310 [Pseudomonadota bacterium]|nr:hypothetical protein [Pseudomonadota bacterium]
MGRSILLAGLLSLTGCATGVVQQGMGPAQPQRPALTDLAQRPQQYAGQYVVVSGRLEHNAYRSGGGRWGFDLLNEDGSGIRCFERAYRRDSPFPVRQLLRRAGHEAGAIEVAGWVDKSGRLELDWIEYAGMRVDTEFVPRPLVSDFAIHF